MSMTLAISIYKALTSVLPRRSMLQMSTNPAGPKVNEKMINNRSSNGLGA